MPPHLDLLAHKKTHNNKPVRNLGIQYMLVLTKIRISLIRCVIQPSSLSVLARDLKTHLFAVGNQRHERIRGVTISWNHAVRIEIQYLFATYLALTANQLQ